jgi:diguanylate cyclase (GGDEF)-like protein
MTKSAMLIVDDSGHLHTLVRSCLEPEPLEIHSAYDGHSAMAAAVEWGPRIVLLDVDIPGPDGFEVCRRLKADPQTTGAAVMFLSADASAQNRSKGLDLGAIDYITKPFEPDKLRARVRTAVRSQHRQQRSGLVDTLTGLWNESYLGEHLAAQLSWAGRSGNLLTCIMAEVEPVGRADERYDDVAGEEILRAVADILISQCRGSDDNVYYCGDGRFAAVLAGTNRVGAESVTERVRLQVERELSRDDGGAIVRCKFGVADTEAKSDVPLLHRAIAAAQGAKQTRSAA